MSELELVWIRECEVCGKEHRYSEVLNIGSIDEVDAKSGAFKNKCEQWYASHVDSLLNQQLGRQRDAIPA